MADPLVVIIPHDLGKAEATTRLKSGVAGLRNAFGGKLSLLEETWSEDRLEFRVGILSQMVGGTIDIAADNVRLTVYLPGLLATLAQKAKALIERQGRLMLERK